MITSIAGYFVILRGSTFTVGDRISMGGVRGDVMRLGFIQTTIMEMGQPRSVQGADPAMWVKSRQFTGRIVTVSNSKIFAEPVFTHTRDFPFIWEEMAIPITYEADDAKAEAILLAAAKAHSVDTDAMAADAKAGLKERFGVEPIDLEPTVYYRITDNWLELTVRFIVHTHRIRSRQGCHGAADHRRIAQGRNRHRLCDLRHRRIPADRDAGFSRHGAGAGPLNAATTGQRSVEARAGHAEAGRQQLRRGASRLEAAMMGGLAGANEGRGVARHHRYSRCLA